MKYDFEKLKSYGLSPRFVIKKWGVIVLCSVFAFVFFLCVFMPKAEYSKAENRELTKKPKFSFASYRSGEYAKTFSAYFTEGFPFREQLLSLFSGVEELYGVRVDDVKIHAPTTKPPQDTPIIAEKPNEDTSSSQSAQQDESSSSSSSESSSSSSAPANPPEEASDVGVVTNGVIVIGNRAMSLFGGNANMAKAYANTISSYIDLFPATTKIYNMVVPTSAEFYLPEKYKNTSAPIKPIIDTIQSSLSPQIYWVDAYSNIAQHTEEYIYFRTDHHWTPLGAYYAYEAFCKKAGITPTPLSDFEAVTKGNFTGSMFSYTQDKVLKDKPDEFTYYKPKINASAKLYRKGSRYYGEPTYIFHEYASGTNTYSLLLGGDYPLVEITTSAGTGKSIVVIKESFGNAFVPFLIPNFDKIYVVDQRYYERSLPELVTEQSIDTVLFLNNAFASTTGAHINWIEALKYEDPLPEPPEEEEQSEPETSSSSAMNDEQMQAIFNTMFGN
ncbi:MAG: hypothetical protein IJC83_03445 [Oscillospiraceae bacterium]|nr:hypothetical protein [Oscillospiraceae bacterium]